MTVAPPADGVHTLLKKFLEVRYNETFLQKGFWSPKAIVSAGWAYTLFCSFSCSLAHPAGAHLVLTGRRGFMPVRSGGENRKKRENRETGEETLLNFF